MPESGRVIAGSARGVRLEAAPTGTRPLADRVKQALFSSLEADGALSDGFLDLFAGTGAAGIEALSRGAERAVFVEKSAAACALIEANLRRAGLEGGQIVRSDVISYLSVVRPEQPPAFRACFIDPPYDDPLVSPALGLLGDRRRGWLTRDAVVVAKHFWRDERAHHIGSLALERQRRFGETMLSYYRQTAEETSQQ
jgi:16S rRNA (guanine966-N2)-methyltransferase